MKTHEYQAKREDAVHLHPGDPEEAARQLGCDVLMVKVRRFPEVTAARAVRA